MAALTANLEVIKKQGVLVSHPVVADDIIFKGAMVKHNAAGYLAPMAAEVGAQFAGFAFEKKDNTGGAAADVSCLVEKDGMYLLTVTGFSIADVGSVVYASDDQTVSVTQGSNELAVGIVSQFVSATQVWVKIDGYAY